MDAMTMIEKIKNNPTIQLLDAEDFHENEMVKGDNGRRLWARDEYKNSSGRLVFFLLDVDCPRPTGKRSPEGAILLGPAAKRLIAVPPGETVLIPRVYRQAILTELCEVCDERQLYCKNEAHHRRVIGGLGIGLTRLGSRSSELHPSLIETQRAAPANGSVARDERLVARALRGAS